LAVNYNSNATQSDGSCRILGCRNETAENYNPNATEDAVEDAEKCVIHGCILDNFPNYNSEATIDDGSCSPFATDIYRCTDTL